MAVGFFIIAGYLVHSLFRGRRAPANPWGAGSLEWQTGSPPPHDNFPEVPAVDDPYDLSALEYDAKSGGFVRVNTRTGSQR
jgi:cytochrome c oxidase subunit 1